MSRHRAALTKSVMRVDASDAGITVAVNYLLKDADDNMIGRAGVTVTLSGREDSSINELRDLASRRADDLLSQIVSLLPSRPET